VPLSVVRSVATRRFVTLALAPAVFPNLLLGQVATRTVSSHLVIPFLASAQKPSDRGFEAGDCEADTAGTSMTDQSQQAVPQHCR
jgi:hypothetical protein